MKIGSKIKRIRELKGFSQTEIAEKLHISQRAYSDIENDKTKLDLERLFQLASIYQIDPIDLINFDEKQVFKNVFKDSSKGFFAEKILTENFDNERKSYLNQIAQLKEEISFLRKLIEKG